MSAFPTFKSKETSINPEVSIAEKKALESMEGIEAELNQAEREVEQPSQAETETLPVADAPPTTPVAAVAPVQEIDPMMEKIEHVLQEDLTDLYLSMTPTQQLMFKDKGEETAAKIRTLLRQAKVNAKKIFDLLRDWLKLIPGVNQFFLEQEAKIKTDQILFINEQEKNQ